MTSITLRCKMQTITLRLCGRNKSMWQTLAVKVLEFVLMAVLDRLIKNPKTPYDNVLKDVIKDSYQGRKKGQP